MEAFLVTDEEKNFILKRRELADKRKKSRNAAPKHPVQTEQQPKQQGNRPPGWDSHCDPSKVHSGRMTEKHPLYWFESEIFKKISKHGLQIVGAFEMKFHLCG